MLGPCRTMPLEVATSEIYFANASQGEDVCILCPAQRQAQESVHAICQDTLLVSVRSHRTHSETLPASADGLADTGTSTFHKQPPCLLFPLYRLEKSRLREVHSACSRSRSWEVAKFWPAPCMVERERSWGAGEENGRVDTLAASLCLRERPFLQNAGPAVSFQGLDPRAMKTHVCTKICTRTFVTALFMKVGTTQAPIH